MASALTVGTVLKAKVIEDPNDPWATIRIVGVIDGVNGEEVCFQPLHGFHPVASAPATGHGSILANFDVLTAAEEASEWTTPVEEIA